MKNKPISEESLKNLLGDSLTSSLCVNIEKATKTWVATGMLVQQLESFTDAVLIRQDDKPIGIVGGKDILEKLIENPTSELFDNTNVEDIMEKRILFVSNQTTLKELINYWKETRRAFAVVPNEFSDYSAISAKKILEIGIRCKTRISISEVPEKKVATFTKNATIGDILKSMFDNNTRRLVLENTTKFINDRMILEKITEDWKYLREVDDFLARPVKDFKLEEAKTVSETLSISDAARELYEMEHPYLVYGNQVLSPWDVCLLLLSEKITDYDLG